MSNSIIEELQSDNSRLVKESIIQREVLAKNDIFFEGCKLALDPLVTFGVKQVPTRDDKSAEGLNWEVFKDLCDSLAQRTLTGHDARDAILASMEACDTCLLYTSPSPRD